MPNQPKTQNRSIRFPDDVWTLVEQVAADTGRTYTDVIVGAVAAQLTRYARRSESIVTEGPATTSNPDEPDYHSYQRCDRCLRKTVAVDEFDSPCGVAQPDGDICPGHFGHLAIDNPVELARIARVFRIARARRLRDAD